MPRASRRRRQAGLLGLLLLLPAVTGADQVEYYHLDSIGSVRVVTDGTGQLVERHDYRPFGEECTEGPCASNPGLASGGPLRFAGKERDAETRLDYFGARYYSAPTGRFTTVDPLLSAGRARLDPQRFNRYSHARGNPLRYVDPDGRELRTTAQATIEAIAGDAAARVTIRNGVLDTSALTAADLSGNEGAALLHDLARSGKVYSYEESATPKGVENLDNRPDWRYQKGKGPGDLPPTGIDDAVKIDPNASYVDAATGTKKVSRAATAFHELAEAYAKIDKQMPYVVKGGGDGAHADARRREQTLIGQRPDFTEYPAGGVVKR